MSARQRARVPPSAAAEGRKQHQGQAVGSCIGGWGAQRRGRVCTVPAGVRATVRSQQAGARRSGHASTGWGAQLDTCISLRSGVGEATGGGEVGEAGTRNAGRRQKAGEGRPAAGRCGLRAAAGRCLSVVQDQGAVRRGRRGRCAHLNRVPPRCNQDALGTAPPLNGDSASAQWGQRHR
jgi:hypothetical protein